MNQERLPALTGGWWGLEAAKGEWGGHLSFTTLVRRLLGSKEGKGRLDVAQPISICKAAVGLAFEWRGTGTLKRAGVGWGVHVIQRAR